MEGAPADDEPGEVTDQAGEGVEDAATLEQLRASGCEFGQGFHWSPAIPLPDLVALLRTQG